MWIQEHLDVGTFQGVSGPSDDDRRAAWDRGKLTGFGGRRSKFHSLRKLCCLVATSHKISSVLQDREVDGRQSCGSSS